MVKVSVGAYFLQLKTFPNEVTFLIAVAALELRVILGRAAVFGFL